MKTTFPANGRHTIEVSFNVQTGLCDVVVSDTQSTKRYIKSLVLEQYNRLVDFFKDNENGFAIQSAQSLF